MAFDPNSPDRDNEGLSDIDQIQENFNQLRCFEAGADAPSSTVAGMPWLYTPVSGDWILRMRNKADDDWVDLVRYNETTGAVKYPSITMYADQVLQWLDSSAADTVILQSKYSGSTYPRFKFDAVGVLMWGPGNTDYDASLYRYGVGILASDSIIEFQKSYDTDVIYRGVVSGDTYPRIKMLSSGKMYWGPGSASDVDTVLYREAANALAVEDELRNIRANATDTAFAARVTGDSYQRFEILADGKMQWGPGSGVADTVLYRSAAGELTTEDILNFIASASTTFVLNAKVSGDTYNRVQIRADGRYYIVKESTGYPYFYLDSTSLNWGSGDASVDVILSRIGANILSLGTGDQFIAPGAITTMTKAGVPGDGDVASASDGTIVLDTTNSRLYIRCGGSWKYAALT